MRMVDHQDNYAQGSETPSRFVVHSTTPGLWSMGLKSGLSPQQMAPLATGTHHKLEVNPFEQSYAYAGRDCPYEEPATEPLRRPRINGLQNMGAGPSKDSQSSTDSRSSNKSRESRSMSMTTADTPPSDVPLSPQALKPQVSTAMLASDSVLSVMSDGLPGTNSAINASAYAEHLARYVQAQAIHATRTSAPLAGQSTSRQPSYMGPASDDADESVMGSPTHSIDSPPSGAIPAAMSSELPSTYEAPRNKKASPTKAVTGPTKRGKVGRPRNVKEEEGEQLTLEEVKRKDFLERNRQAACKSRQKRKAWQANLESEAQRLTESNGQLQSLVSSLREEIASLRATVVGHAANGCQAARLALQAARPGDVPMAAFVLPSPTVTMQSPTVNYHHHHNGSPDLQVGQHLGMVDGAIAYHHPTAIEAQRSRSTHGPSEMTSYPMGAGASYFDVAAAAAAMSSGPLGRSSDVDMSVYLA